MVATSRDQGAKKNRSGSVASLGKSNSLPALSASKRSPLQGAQPFCQVDIRSRKTERGGVSDGKVRSLPQKKMGIFASERGLQYNQDSFKAHIPPETLPPIADIVRMAQVEFPWLGQAGSIQKPPRRDPSFGGCGLHRCGPRLPLQGRESPRLDLETPPPSPPPKPKDPKKKKEMKEDPKNVSFDETVAKLFEKRDDSPASPESSRYEDDDEAWMSELEIPWSEEELRMVFFKFDSDRDNELDVDDLVPLLRYLGARPNPDEIKKIIESVTLYNTMGWPEYLEFIRRFREADLATLKNIFKEADDDKSGKLSGSEVETLLRKLGYAPTAQTIHEAMDVVDQDHSGEVSFREFEELREYLRKTEGFMQQDLNELRTLFELAAGGKNRDLNTDEIWRITMFRGYAPGQKEIAQIAAEVDADGTGSIDFGELLKVIRRLRDIERDRVLKILRSRGDLHGSKLPVADLGIALKDLGYFVSEEAVNEILDSLGDCEDEDNLTLEELMYFLLAYRRREGFSTAELKELTEAFNNEDSGNKGSIGALELGRILRSFGFPSSLQKVQRLVEEIDFDGSGMLEVDEFTKLMRRLLQGEAQKRQEVFHLLDPGKTGKIPLDGVMQALKILEEVTPNKKHVDKALAASTQPGAKSITSGRFENIYKVYRQSVVEEIRTNAGYGPKEIMTLQQIFDTYDRDKSGTIERNELQKLITQYFPDATKSRSQQVEMQKMLQNLEVGANRGQTGEVDFHKFVWLMRKCDDMRDEADVRLESEVVKQCGLTVEEVEGFRQIFSAQVGWTGELDLHSLTELLQCVVDLSDEEEQALGSVVQEVHPHGRQVARFPQFLRLVKRLTDGNILGVNEAVQRAMKREQNRKTRCTIVGKVEKDKEHKEHKEKK